MRARTKERKNQNSGPLAKKGTKEGLEIDWDELRGCLQRQKKRAAIACSSPRLRESQLLKHKDTFSRYLCTDLFSKCF